MFAKYPLYRTFLPVWNLNEGKKPVVCKRKGPGTYDRVIEKNAAIPDSIIKGSVRSRIRVRRCCRMEKLIAKVTRSVSIIDDADTPGNYQGIEMI